jgi:hypothetical protein
MDTIWVPCQMLKPESTLSRRSLLQRSVHSQSTGVICEGSSPIKASRFNSYSEFCTGHPEALDILRRIRSQFPYEWNAFELRSSLHVSNVLELVENDAMSMNDAVQASEQLMYKGHKRTTSLTSIDEVGRTLMHQRANSSKENVFESKQLKHSRRLAFVDYLIKPIQRICRYPLLLDQLKADKSLSITLSPRSRGRGDTNVVVDSATQAMKHVASLVDEARHRQSIVMQTSLIVSRMVLVNPPSADYTHDLGELEFITPSFLSSLGVCLLAGSLDVLHHQPSKPQSSSVYAKYLGAFLYLGGYLILVKVGKGKIYEPRHWFCLSDFDIVDVEDEGGMSSS